MCSEIYITEEQHTVNQEEPFYNSKNRLNVWVLSDYATGNVNQSKALAKIMDWDFKEIPIHYNTLSKLPNFMHFAGSILKKRIPYITFGTPNIVISCGRKLARVAYEIKQSYPEIKIIQILNPSMDFKIFDLVILPKHDRAGLLSRFSYIFSYAEQVKQKNLCFIDGAITFKSSEQNISSTHYTKAQYSDLIKSANGKLCISILIGGPSNSCRFNKIDIDKLSLKIIAEINHIPENIEILLLISNSRRTPYGFLQILKTRLKKITKKTELYIYDIHNPSEEQANPYSIFLDLAQKIIITADSVSMCMDAIYTNKPVYIYLDNNMLSKKHLRFINQLLDKNVIATLEYFNLPYQFNNQHDIFNYNTLKKRIASIL